MKKLMIAVAILAGLQVAQAQPKSVTDSKKAIETALSAAQNAKKATKAATWLKLGEAYVKAYDAPIGNIWSGASKQDLALVMGNEKPSTTETVVLNGEQMTKEVYADKNLYFRGNGQLAIIEVTQTADKDALVKAAEAYQKAYSLDNKKSKDVVEALKGISGKLVQDAYNQYSLGNPAAASELFEKAANVVSGAPVSKIDTNSIYNAGFTALNAKDNERAKKFFEQCYKLGYYSENGAIFAKLAEIDPTKAKQYLEEGFEKYPASQEILIGLINYYVGSGESTDRLFELLDKAKANEPNNSSLYYVEGNIRSKLGDNAAAVAAYRKCNEIDPNNAFGYIGEGILHYNEALDIQTKAQTEQDDAKYMALVEQFEKALKDCLPPFEKAFEVTKDNEIKKSIAEYLKQVYFRFRDQDPSYETKYKYYSEYGQ